MKTETPKNREPLYGAATCSDPVFQRQYLMSPLGSAPACPACERGKLRKRPLGWRCEGDHKHGVHSCGYKSWRPNANLTGNQKPGKGVEL